MVDNRLDTKYQLETELMAIALLFCLLFLSGAFFFAGAGEFQLDVASKDLSEFLKMPIEITPHFFGIFCWLGAFTALLFRFSFFRNQTAEWKRRFYILTPSPILFYCITLGWRLYRLQVVDVRIVIYLAIYFAFVVIARATYRN